MKDICINCHFKQEMQPQHKKDDAKWCCVVCWDTFINAYNKFGEKDGV